MLFAAISTVLTKVRAVFLYPERGDTMSVQYDGLDVESIVNDISRWTEDRARKIDEAGKRIQEEMIPEVSAVTPVRQRGGDGKHMKDAWVRQEITVRGGMSYGMTGNGKVYGVRNKLRPTVEHLLNFGHSLILHDKFIKEVHGSRFVTNISDRRQAEFEREIERILNGDE